MDRVKIMEIGYRNSINTDVFGEFITQGFPNEMDENYIEEWAGRFATGTPELFMDGESKQIFRNIIDKY